MRSRRRTTATRYCPKCKPSPVLEIRDVPEVDDDPIEIDVCNTCRGVWLDWGEIGEIKAMVAAIDGLSSSSQWKKDLQIGHCPACDNHPDMHRVEVGAFGVDRCPECLGLWFDGGELGAVLTDQGFDALLRALRADPPA